MRDWVEYLQEVLAYKAASEFQNKTLTKDEFREFINELTTVVDWDDEFIKKTYELFLDKVNYAGGELTKKVN